MKIAARVAFRAKIGFFLRYHSTTVIKGRKLAVLMRMNVLALCRRQAAINGFCSAAQPIDTIIRVLNISVRQISERIMLSMLISLLIP